MLSQHTLTVGFDLARRQRNGESSTHRGVLDFRNQFGRDAITNLRMGTPGDFPDLERHAFAERENLGRSQGLDCPCVVNLTLSADVLSRALVVSIGRGLEQYEEGGEQYQQQLCIG